MIKLEQPSFCFNSYDIGEPHYWMTWKTMVGAQGMRASELAGSIFASNVAALKATGKKLQNIVINTHGNTGTLHLGGVGKAATYRDDLAVFAMLKPANIGTIWIVGCRVANDMAGSRFCQALATLAGTQVIASEDDQEVTAGQAVRHFLAPRDNIDDLEGVVWSFTPGAAPTRGIDPERDVWTVRS
jgi:hypothetical protein